MRTRILLFPAWACALLLVSAWTPTAAGAAEPFEVEVLLGSTQSRVTRDAEGVTHEVILREAPSLPVAEPEPEDRDRAEKGPTAERLLTVTVISEPERRVFTPVFVGSSHRRFGPHRKPHFKSHSKGRALHGSRGRSARHRGGGGSWARYRLPSF
jgi:hypothetical protein